MSKENKLKSAYELAMERLQADDKKQGVERSTPLTSRQKKEITRLRQEAKAKLAELEILHGKNLAGAQDPEKLIEIEKHYQVDRERVESALESKIAKVRKQDSQA